MSALFDKAVRALAHVATPGARVIIVLSVEAGEHDDMHLRMRVVDDCDLGGADAATILTQAAGMALDPGAHRHDETVRVS